MERTEFNTLLTNADTGDIDAMNKLHDLYATVDFGLNNFTKKDIDTYIAQATGPYALYHVAYLLYVRNDIKRCKKYLIKSADKECSQAYVLLASLIDDNLIKYDSTFEELIDKSVSCNNSNAYIERAETCKGNAKVKLLKWAIKLQNRYAYHMLGLHYHDSNDYKRARQYYKKSIDSGIHVSYFNLAVMYREGEGVKKDPKKAIQLFKTARKRGCNRAASAIGCMYYMSGDTSNAEKYLIEAIELGDPLACYNFGMMHKENGALAFWCNQKAGPRICAEHKSQGDMYEAMRHFVEGARRGSKGSKIEVAKFGISDLNVTDEEIKKCCDLYEMTKYFGANDYY